MFASAITVPQHEILSVILNFCLESNSFVMLRLKYFQLLAVGANYFLVLQVSLSYQVAGNLANVVSIPEEKAAFNITVDPTRMLSIHCLNFPKADICPWLRHFLYLPTSLDRQIVNHGGHDWKSLHLFAVLNETYLFWSCLTAFGNFCSQNHFATTVFALKSFISSKQCNALLSARYDLHGWLRPVFAESCRLFRVNRRKNLSLIVFEMCLIKT